MTAGGPEARPPADKDRMTSSTTSRFRSMSPRPRASRFRRRSGSVFDGRTFMCQSSAVTSSPSMWDTSPSGPNRSFTSWSFSATSETGVFSSPVRK